MAKHTLFGRMTLAASVMAAGLILGGNAHAQFAGTPDPATFRDTSMLKPPAGQKVAIVEFVDLECPACRAANPIVQKAAAQYHVPIVRYDFPLQMHIWSRDAAITARYLQDKVSPELADQFRRDVFAHQISIASKDDLSNYTRQWFGAHHQQVPFVMDPAGRFAAEVQGDYTLGERLGVQHTPTIVVAGPHGWVEVNDVTQLYTTIDNVLAQSPATPAPAHNMHKVSAPAK